MNITRREFIKGLMAVSSLIAISPQEVFLSDKIKILYSETDWMRPEDQAVYIKQLFIERAHVVDGVEKSGYASVIAVTDKEWKSTEREKIYKYKKEQSLISLYDYIQNTEKIGNFTLIEA